jgi:hypothetical protein
MIGRRAAAVALLLAAVGCVDGTERSDAPFDHLQFRRVSSAPGFVSLRPLEIHMERGLAVRARVSAIGTDGRPLDLLSLRSSNTQVFTVDPGPRLGEFVLHGARVGTVAVDIYSDGRHVGEVPATITEQTP